MIYYYCPDMVLSSGGIRRIYRHAAILKRNNIPAAVLHNSPDFRMPDMPDAPLACLKNVTLGAEDIVVIPEGFPDLMYELRKSPARRFAIALNWSYIYKTLPDQFDWRALGIERIIAVAPFIAEMLSWSMGLPVHLLDFAIDPALYNYVPEDKRPTIAYILRKGEQAPALRRLLRSRNPDFADKLEWLPLDNLSEKDYASKIHRASIFLNLSFAEGIPASCLEAMRAGCLVAGYSSIGGQGVLRGAGDTKNCLLVETGDYVTLAKQLEPVLEDLLSGTDTFSTKWQQIIRNGRRLAATHTPDSEEKSVLAFWQQIVHPAQ